MTDLFVSESKTQAKEAAYAAVQLLKPKSTPLIEYKSRGKVVVIGDSKVIEALGELPEPLTLEKVVFEGGVSSSDITIEGALGQFLVNVSTQQIKADLVLDLSSKPILKMALKPPGYIVSGHEKNELEEAKEELHELTGTFDKPKYFDYNESLCAHGVSGKPGCTRCLDACPAEAITSLVNKIAVDPFRCQGGGICATVCPSGAITYSYPKPRDLLTHVRTLVLTYLKEITEIDGKTTAPDLVFVTEDQQDRAVQIMPAALVIAVEEVASVGPEVWLSALAWGARSVRLFNLDGMPDSAENALDLHLQMTQKTLAGMGYPENCISLVADQGELITSSSLTQKKTASHAPLGDKRQAFYMALDHLSAQADEATVEANQEIALPQGAIFGEAIIDKSKCTLCMSCVGACPGNALQDGRELPQVSLVEDKCLQCGICVSTCPEDAISIAPRLLLDRRLRSKPRVLHQDEPFCCIKCAKPFATNAGIETILKKLSGHYMFTDERSRDRLKMCDDCRVVDMVEDPNSDL
ncbi:MAG: ferredoxin [Cocleimonas sp.]|jgi:ferredoxin